MRASTSTTQLAAAALLNSCDAPSAAVQIPKVMSHLDMRQSGVDLAFQQRALALFGLLQQPQVGGVCRIDLQ